MPSAENFVKLYVESHNHLDFMTTHFQATTRKVVIIVSIPRAMVLRTMFHDLIFSLIVTDRHVQKFLRS